MNRSPITTIQFAQHNMSRARHVTDELRTKIIEKSVDILLLQQMHTTNNEPSSLGSNVKIITSNLSGQRPWAAIAVANENMATINLKHLGNDRVAIAEININAQKIYVISAYAPPRQNPSLTLDVITLALNKLKGCNIIIGMDSEGETVENFGAQHDLQLLNKGNQPTTFCSSQGSSNIDITHAKGAVAGWVQNWCVRDTQ